jgi:hypothetical protein
VPVLAVVPAVPVVVPARASGVIPL